MRLLEHQQAMATKIRWTDLLSSKDLGVALPAVLDSLELEFSAHFSGTAEGGLASLAQAIAASLSQSNAGNPSRAFLAASALLAALDLHFPIEVESALVSEAVVKSVVASSASTWPLVAALSVRCLCCLVVATQRHQHSKEERQEKQAWTRKVIPQIKATLEAHPKSFHVQEAVAKGCCALFLDGQQNFGGQIATLWPVLWPLAVHPRAQIAQASSLALCRMTWLSRGGDVELPSAEKAMDMACSEVSQLFNQSVLPNLGGKLNPGAILQCVRLVEFLQSLLLYSRTRPADLPAARRTERRTGDMEDTLVVLPLPKIMNLIELLLGSLLKESEFAAEICGNQAAPSELLKLLNGVLDLLCVAVEVAGTALLMFTAQIRQWLELLTDRSPKTDGRHCVAVFKFIRRLERNSPAILLRQPLLSRLCQYALDAMHHDTLLQNGEAQRLPISKKRKADVLREDVLPQGLEGQIFFSSACEALARLIDSGSSLVSQSVIGGICEQVVQTIWHGLLHGTSRSVSGKEIDKCLAYRRVCRDPASVLGLLNVIHVLLQPRQMDAVPLAPSLLHAFAALISVLQDGFERHALGSPGVSGDSSVRLRLREISDTLRFDRFGSNKVREGMGIVWPEGEASSAIHAIASPDAPETALKEEPPAPISQEQRAVENRKDMEVEQNEAPDAEDLQSTKDDTPKGVPQDAEDVKNDDPKGPTVPLETVNQIPQVEPVEVSAPSEAVPVPEAPEATAPAEPTEVPSPPVLPQQAVAEPSKLASKEAEEFFTPRNAEEAAGSTGFEEPQGSMELFSPSCLAEF